MEEPFPKFDQNSCICSCGAPTEIHCHIGCCCCCHCLCTSLHNPQDQIITSCPLLDNSQNFSNHNFNNSLINSPISKPNIITNIPPIKDSSNNNNNNNDEIFSKYSIYSKNFPNENLNLSDKAINFNNIPKNTSPNKLDKENYYFIRKLQVNKPNKIEREISIPLSHDKKINYTKSINNTQKDDCLNLPSKFDDNKKNNNNKDKKRKYLNTLPNHTDLTDIFALDNNKKKDKDKKKEKNNEKNKEKDKIKKKNWNNIRMIDNENELFSNSMKPNKNITNFNKDYCKDYFYNDKNININGTTKNNKSNSVLNDFTFNKNFRKEKKDDKSQNDIYFNLREKYNGFDEGMLNSEKEINNLKNELKKANDLINKLKQKIEYIQKINPTINKKDIKVNKPFSINYNNPNNPNTNNNSNSNINTNMNSNNNTKLNTNSNTYVNNETFGSNNNSNIENNNANPNHLITNYPKTNANSNPNTNYNNTNINTYPNDINTMNTNNINNNNNTMNTNNNNNTNSSSNDFMNKIIYENSIKEKLNDLSKKIEQNELLIEKLQNEKKSQELTINSKNQEIEKLLQKIQSIEKEYQINLISINTKTNDFLKKKDIISNEYKANNNLLKEELMKLNISLQEKESKIREYEVQIKEDKKAFAKKEKILEILFAFYLHVKKVLGIEDKREILKDIIEVIQIEEFEERVNKIGKKFKNFYEDIQVRYGKCFACDIGCCTSQVEKLKAFRKNIQKKK